MKKHSNTVRYPAAPAIPPHPRNQHPRNSTLKLRFWASYSSIMTVDCFLCKYILYSTLQWVRLPISTTFLRYWNLWFSTFYFSAKDHSQYQRKYWTGFPFFQSKACTDFPCVRVTPMIQSFLWFIYDSLAGWRPCLANHSVSINLGCLSPLALYVACSACSTISVKTQACLYVAIYVFCLNICTYAFAFELISSVWSSLQK